MALRKFVFLNPTEGYSEEQAATDELSLGKVTAVGVGGIAFDASSQRIVNVAAPTTGTDAVNRDYVQAYAAGLDWKQSVRLATAAALPANTAAGSGVGKTLTADANGALTVDGVAVAVGNRILVKDETPGSDNGIYVVTDAGSGGTPYVLTRATDADENAEVTAGVAVFAAEGTANSDSGWVLTTNDPITVDTTALVFAQFTGTGAIIAGAGLLKTGSTIDVELDTAAGAQTAGADGGSSGLEFDVTGVGGKLRAKVDPAGGIQRLSAGLALEIDDTPNTLDVDADGLKVVGVPLQFLIDDVATSTAVTAANVNTLVAGADSAADALHFHSNHVQVWTTSANTDLGDGVYISGNNTVAPGAPSVDAQARIIGVARETVTSPNPVEIVVSGVVPGALSGATANAPYFLGTGGAPVLYGALGAGDRTIALGYAKNATDLEVRIRDLGKKS